MVFDQTKYLPNWKEAEIHGKASKIGFFDEEDKDVCQCCHQKVKKEEIPLCENTKKLEFLGFGFPLFYMFIRNCIILLILLIISNNLISLFISISDGTAYCKAHPATPEPLAHPVAAAAPHHFFFSRENAHFQHVAEEKPEDPNLFLSRKCDSFFLMIARTDKVQKDYEIVLRIGSFIIHVLTLLYIKDKLIKTWEYYDEMESDLSDYAVIVKNIPEKVTGVRQRFEDFFAKEVKDENQKSFLLHQIILIPETDKVHELHHEEEEVLEKYLHAKHEGEHLDHHIKELQELHHKKMEIVEKTVEDINRDTTCASNAIIIFEKEKQKLDFLEQVDEEEESWKIAKYFNNNPERIIFEEAPEPREIIYENLQHSRHLIKNICIGWGLSLLFLLVITVVFYFIQLIKTNNLVAAIEAKEENPNSHDADVKKTVATIIAWTTLFGIVFFNKFIMGNVLHYFTHLEKHDNKANEDFSFAFKYALGMFFTTALMTIAVEALKFKNYYKHDFGVIQEETIMFILCAFLVPLIWLIHPLQQCHVLTRNKHYGHPDVTQHEANHLMADYHYDMGKRYAELIEMMWFTFLYADLIPIGAFLILVGFCIYYWVDKYNLLRRSSLEGNISGDLAMKCLFLLDLTLFWRFLGELIFDNQIRDGAKTQTIIFLVLSILYMLVPWEAFLKLVNHEDFKLNDKLFSDEKHRFNDDNYKIYHPIYREIINKYHERGGQLQLDINEVFLHGKAIADANKNNNSNVPKVPNVPSVPSVPYSPFAPSVNPANPAVNSQPWYPPGSIKPSVSFNYK